MDDMVLQHQFAICLIIMLDCELVIVASRQFTSALLFALLISVSGCFHAVNVSLLSLFVPLLLWCMFSAGV